MTGAPLKIEETSDPAMGIAARAGIRVRSILQTMLFQPNDVQTGATSDGEVISARTTLLMGQDFPSETARQPWTIVTASNAGTLKAGVDCLTRPQVWSRLNGRLSSLAADESIAWVPADDRTRYRSTQSFGIFNARLVAAGWLSLNPLTYVGFALAIVALLGTTTLWLVRNIGRRQE